jgi:predicted ATPase
MLKSWSIENFKPIVNSGELKLAPVTVLAGRNSSGKSSLLQSILMIAQTLSNQLPERALLPNGPLVQLGTFEDILSTLSGSRNITVQFEISNELEMMIRQGILEAHRSSDYKVAVTFGSGNADNSNSPAIEASRVEVEKTSLLFHIESIGTDSENQTVTGDFTFHKMSEEELKGLKLSSENVAPDKFPRIPASVGDKYNYLAEYTYHITPDIYQNASATFLVTLTHFLPDGIVAISKETRYPIAIVDFDDDRISLIAITNQITRFFSSQIRYLGPLRADPGTTQRTFAPTSELDDVGFRGEYAAVVYHNNQAAQINWYNPNTAQIEKGTLQIALDAWARYLGVAHQVRTETGGPGGIAWKVVIKQGLKPRTLPEVGGGLNHVLPILVMGLLAPENTLLIIEEPEVTLHPSVQARLGDFFVGMSKCKKQFLIETHSENLVSQLRYHIVQAGGMQNSDCMIYFVDQDEKGAAKFEQVEISARGNILNWPDGFFDETMHQEDRITSASIRRRAKLAKNG